MSIKNVRLNEIINNIIGDAIKDGLLPSSRIVLSRINEYVFKNDLSRPMFKLRTINRKDITDSKLYNTGLDEAYKDLVLLYERLSYHDQILESQVERTRAQRETILQQINKLKDEVEVLALKFNNKGITDVLFDTFADTSKVDMSNTTAAVNKMVSIPELSTKSAKIEKAPPTVFKVFGDNNDVSSYGDISVIYNESNPLGWSCVVKSDEEEDVTVKIKIDFTEYKTPVYSSLPERSGVLLNKLEILSTIDSNIKIEYMYDDNNTLPLPYYSGSEKIRRSYDFPEILVKQLYLTLTKDKADSITTDNKYEYIFNINKLNFYTYSYYDEAEFQSILLSSTSNINKVSLSVKEETPETTTIDYYIGMDNNWTPISALEDVAPQHSQVIDLLNVEAASSTIYKIPSTQSKVNQELVSLRWNGIHFYKLGALKNKISNSILYCGKNAITVNGKPVAINKDKPSLLYTGVDANIEFDIFCMQNVSFKTTPVTNMNFYMILNDAEIPVGSPNIPLTLVRGWNKFKISLSGNGSFDLGYDLTKAGNIYASNKPMDLVDIFDLQRVVRMDDHTKYAIKDNYIVVNDYYPDIEYELIYDYISNEVNSIKLKAVLKRNGSQVTPKLHAYYINTI